MIWDFERLVSRRLLLWAFPSMLAGLGLILFGNAFWRAFGIQFLAWGAVDALIAWLGLRNLNHKVDTRKSYAEEAQEASRMRNILWINNALDVLYVASGAALVYFLGSEAQFWQGTGWGIILQGTFLFVFDLAHALRVPDPLQLPHLPLFTHPDHESFFFKGGTPAAVLVHGFPGTALEMRPLGEALHAAGWTVNGLRLPGFGPDLADLIEYGNRDWVDAVLEACHDLRSRGHAPLLLLGYSFGAALALQAAAEFQVDGLVLIAPLTWREPAWGKALVDFFRTLLPLSVQPFRYLPMDQAALAKQYQPYLPEIDFDDPEQRAELARFQFPLAVLDQLRVVGKKGLEAAQKVNAPTLLIHSTGDPIVQPRSINYLVSQLAGPTTKESVTDPHSLTLPQHPAFKTVAAKALAFAADIQKLHSTVN